MTARETKTEKLDLRVSPATKRTLRDAARAAGRSVSEFVIHSALDRAEEELADRRRLALDAERWTAFQAALDAPVRPAPRLAKLFAEPSVFERESAE